MELIEPAGIRSCDFERMASCALGVLPAKPAPASESQYRYHGDAIPRYRG
jgi:hypothetical protein